MRRPGLFTGVATAALLLAAAALLLAAAPARAEFRAYQLEVTDILDCLINKLEKCKKFQVTTSMSPELYVRTHGGEGRIGAIMLATWMCRGDTSGFRAVCPRPGPREPKFSQGDQVTVTLQRHVTEGWRGTVEVAYYQRSIRGNVYGLRFPDHRDVYGRYYEKDLKKADAAEAGTPATAAAPGAAAATAGAGAPATQ